MVLQPTPLKSRSRSMAAALRNMGCEHIERVVETPQKSHGLLASSDEKEGCHVIRTSDPEIEALWQRLQAMEQNWDVLKKQHAQRKSVQTSSHHTRTKRHDQWSFSPSEEAIMVTPQIPYNRRNCLDPRDSTQPTSVSDGVLLKNEGLDKMQQPHAPFADTTYASSKDHMSSLGGLLRRIKSLEYPRTKRHQRPPRRLEEKEEDNDHWEESLRVYVPSHTKLEKYQRFHNELEQNNRPFLAQEVERGRRPSKIPRRVKSLQVEPSYHEHQKRQGSIFYSGNIAQRVANDRQNIEQSSVKAPRRLKSLPVLGSSSHELRRNQVRQTSSRDDTRRRVNRQFSLRLDATVSNTRQYDDEEKKEDSALREQLPRVASPSIVKHQSELENLRSPFSPLSEVIPVQGERRSVKVPRRLKSLPGFGTSYVFRKQKRRDQERRRSNSQDDDFQRSVNRKLSDDSRRTKKVLTRSDDDINTQKSLTRRKSKEPAESPWYTANRGGHQGMGKEDPPEDGKMMKMVFLPKKEEENGR